MADKAHIGELIPLRAVCQALGLSLPEIRKLAEHDPTFPPIEWAGPRSGHVWREDFEAWKAARHERARDRARQQKARETFLRGGSSEDLPEFLRGQR